MSERIFGYKWEEIQHAQRWRGSRLPAAKVDLTKPSRAAATDEDRALLAQYGSLEALEGAGLYGVADRLRCHYPAG